MGKKDDMDCPIDYGLHDAATWDCIPAAHARSDEETAREETPSAGALFTIEAPELDPFVGVNIGMRYI